jgi:hypothetical protein
MGGLLLVIPQVLIPSSVLFFQALLVMLDNNCYLLCSQEQGPIENSDYWGSGKDGVRSTEVENSRCDARHLVRLRPGGEHGGIEESPSVLLSFDAKSLPDKVMLGYISYPVQGFVPNPLWYFRCQAYGHGFSRV